MSTIITLISDWRLRDPYLSMFKGQILGALPNAQILDITHHIDSFNIAQSAFLMKQSYAHFPEGTIHFILTNTSTTATEAPVVLMHNNHYFISNDNGVFFLMFGKEQNLSGHKSKDDSSQNTLYQMIKLAEHIVSGSLEKNTLEYTDFKRILSAEPIHLEFDRTIEGEIIYIDAEFNAVTNIPTSLFKEAVQNQPFNAHIHSKTEWKTEKFHESYTDENGIYLTSCGLGNIEITMFRADVSILASLNVGDKVTIHY